MKKSKKDLIREIAKLYNIKIYFNSSLKNESASSFQEIEIGEYESEDCMLVDFFHELAHLTFDKYINIKNSRFGKTVGKNFLYFSNLSHEALMWEIGFRLASRFGYEWDYRDDVYRHAYKHLLTYVLSEYDDYLIDENAIKLIEDNIFKHIKRSLRNDY